MSNDADAVETVAQGDAARQESPAESWAVGSQIGRYVFIGELGRGGMGRVVRAYDPKLQREVALKEVRRDRLDEHASARLIAEARAMAKLSHPNVVPVYDVEVSGEGHVLLVMEFVAGATLRDWLKAEQRGWREILEPVIAAGRGLAAAHAQGLLHRDFKPGNVLIGEDGTAKVTDFGLAKDSGEPSPSLGYPADSPAASPDMTGELTQTGTVLGTPRYMPPEQHAGLDELTPAADQYALCVTAWEALCGRPPFSGKDIAVAKVEGPPAWPEVAVPRRIASAIRRGLSVSPQDRWPSVDVLLEELSFDPGRRRRRLALLGGALGIAGLAAFAARSGSREEPCRGAREHLDKAWSDARRGEVENALLTAAPKFARAVWTRTAQTLDDYTEEWARVHTEACEATNLRREQSEEILDRRMACLHGARAEIEAVTDVLANADNSVVLRAHEVLAGLRPLSDCSDIEALQADVPLPTPDERQAVAAVRERVAHAEAERTAGHYARAREEIEAAEDLLEELEYAPIASEVAVKHALVLDAVGQYAAAEGQGRRALGLAVRNRQWSVLREAAGALIWIGQREGDPRRMLGYVDLIGNEDTVDAAMEKTLAQLYLALGDLDAAVEHSRRALAAAEARGSDSSTALLLYLDNLGMVLRERGELPEAEAVAKRGVEAGMRVLGERHPALIAARHNLASIMLAENHYAEAEAELRPTVALVAEVFGPDHPAMATVFTSLGTALRGQGRPQQAEAELRKALALAERTLGDDHPTAAMVHGNLANALKDQGRLEEAEASARQAVAIHEGGAADTLGTTVAQINLASILAARDKHEEAEQAYRSVLAQRERSLPAEHPATTYAAMLLADFLLDRGRFVEARPLAERAWKDVRPDRPPDDRALAAFAVARAIVDDDPERARKLAQQSQRVYAEDADDPDNADRVQKWLAAHGK